MTTTPKDDGINLGKERVCQLLNENNKQMMWFCDDACKKWPLLAEGVNFKNFTHDKKRSDTSGTYYVYNEKASEIDDADFYNLVGHLLTKHGFTWVPYVVEIKYDNETIYYFLLKGFNEN